VLRFCLFLLVVTALNVLAGTAIIGACCGRFPDVSCAATSGVGSVVCCSLVFVSCFLFFYTHFTVKS
jgi:hypothetical protein